MKGMALNLSADSLANLCAEMEHVAGRGHAPDSESLFDQIEAMWQEVDDVLSRLNV